MSGRSDETGLARKVIFDFHATASPEILKTDNKKTCSTEGRSFFMSAVS